ncbi:Transcriptional regulator, AraC family protein [Sandaracinus amylolyticus]|uniref:Transcriptional regulator, AraC family protein n=1 Tax=Sandaracinus amylolyticus TaxID=927083 RepID=A0A0F6YKR3_9BACT|nr:Transcriptional regulator, AraC family protein [Sandaracinus amylolyticus]
MRDETLRVGVLALDGCLEFAVAGFVEVLAIADRLVAMAGGSRRFEVAVVAPRIGAETFTARRVAVDVALSAWRGDLLVCAPVIDPERTLASERDAIAWLAERPSARVASVCTGAFFLAEAGLLARRRATTNPLYARAFAARYPDVELELSRVIVDEGEIVTAGTVSAALSLALYVVERHAGVEIAARTAKAIAFDKNRETQSPYLVPAHRVEDGDELAVRAQRWIEAHHADHALSLERIAAALAVTPRTLQRRFLDATGETPMAYLRLVRLEAAKSLLESTRAPVDEIVARVGYVDARSFARLFRAHTELTPTQYRARFGLR